MLVARPSLSQAVRSPEAKLGVELFNRDDTMGESDRGGGSDPRPRRVRLCVGTAVARAVADVVGLEAGHLDLVCLPTLAVHPTAALIGAFRRDHPAVAVRVIEPEDVDQVAEQVRQGGSEVGLTDGGCETGSCRRMCSNVRRFVALVPAELSEQLPVRLTVESLSRPTARHDAPRHFHAPPSRRHVSRKRE